MFPFTKEEMRKAYEYLGVKPIQGQYKGKNDCCGITAIVCSRLNISLKNITIGDIFDERNKMFPQVNDLCGFLVGFDGLYNYYNVDYYNFGKECWEHVKDLA